MTKVDLRARLDAATKADPVLDLQILALVVDPENAGGAINERGEPTELADHLEVPAFTADLPAARARVEASIRTATRRA